MRDLIDVYEQALGRHNVVQVAENQVLVFETPPDTDDLISTRGKPVSVDAVRFTSMQDAERHVRRRALDDVVVAAHATDGACVREVGTLAGYTPHGYITVKVGLRNESWLKSMTSIGASVFVALKKECE